MHVANTLWAFKQRVKALRRSDSKATAVVDALKYGLFLWKSFRDLILAPGALMRFRSKTEGKDIAGRVAVVMNEFGGLLRPIQNPNELTRWIQRVAGLRPKVLVEIGTAKGGTLYLHALAADPNATIISVDLPAGLYGGGYPEWKTHLFRRIIGRGPTIHFVRADSHSPDTVAHVKSLLGGRPIDVLFIDGDHSYAGVATDFRMYRPLVRPGGLIGLHDILENRYDPDIQVAKFWSELKSSYEVEEIVDSPAQGHFGVGVFVVPEPEREVSFAQPSL
jgi:cephalosporin hydroxylase